MVAVRVEARAVVVAPAVAVVVAQAVAAVVRQPVPGLLREAVDLNGVSRGGLAALLERPPQPANRQRTVRFAMNRPSLRAHPSVSPAVDKPGAQVGLSELGRSGGQADEKK